MRKIKIFFIGICIAFLTTSYSFALLTSNTLVDIVIEAAEQGQKFVVENEELLEDILPPHLYDHIKSNHGCAAMIKEVWFDVTSLICWQKTTFSLLSLEKTKASLHLVAYLLTQRYNYVVSKAHNFHVVSKAHNFTEVLQCDFEHWHCCFQRLPFQELFTKSLIKIRSNPCLDYPVSLYLTARALVEYSKLETQQEEELFRIGMVAGFIFVLSIIMTGLMQ